MTILLYRRTIQTEAISRFLTTNWKREKLYWKRDELLGGSISLAIRENRQRNIVNLWQINHYIKKKKRKKALTSRWYVCPVIFHNSWESLIPNHWLYAMWRQRALNLISSEGQYEESQKNRKQPDILHFYNWLIQRIPLSVKLFSGFSEDLRAFIPK